MTRLNYTLSCCLAVFAFGLFALAPAALQAQYCEGPVNAADDEWITNVTFANVSHNTAFSENTANQINATGNVTVGEAVDFSVEVTTDFNSFTEAVVIYFDFDNDFTFETSLDLGTQPVGTAGAIFDASTAPGGSNTVTMPSTPGTYRMRVVLDFFGPVPGPCNADNTSSFKDSEDYEIVVTGGGGGGPTCDDGIQNGDETGVDCGGSCAPCVTPPTCDDGIQNGDEEGVDCGGSSCAPCQVTCENFELTINFDDYASETSWEMTNINGALAASNSYSASASGTTTVEDICLDPGCYEYTIFDSFGDGICCSFGNGSYSLTDSDGSVVASGGDFGSSETTLVCTDPGPDCVAPTASAMVVSYCNNGVFMVMVNLGSLGSANAVTISNSGGQPALQNIFFPRRYFVGPFQIGEEVDIRIYDQENTACITVLEGLTDNCNTSLSTPGNLTSEATLNEISVFPNPTAGDVNVNLGSVMGQEANIRIMNAVGQLIEERQIDAVENVTERFDLSNQQAGMYFIHVDVAGGESHVERVILGTARP